MVAKKIVMLILLVCVSVVPVSVNASDQMNDKVFKNGSSGVGEYRLGKYDVLNVVIIGFSEQYFSNSSYDSSDVIGQVKTTNSNGFNDVVIGPDGCVNLPYAGNVKLSGLTIPQATELLTNKLGEYIKIPSMTLVVKQYGPRKVYVMGEVEKQGVYALSSEYMNVFAAISSAGGITKRGRPKHIAVVHVVDGKMQMKEVSLDGFIENQDASQNALLEDGDMVYVPRSNKIVLAEDVMPIVNMYALFRTLSN